MAQPQRQKSVWQSLSARWYHPWRWCVWSIPSYQVKPGDVIEIKEKHKGKQRYKDILEVTDGRIVPEWLEADHENLSGVVKEVPTREQIDVPVNEVLIVELYSK